MCSAMPDITSGRTYFHHTFYAPKWRIIPCGTLLANYPSVLSRFASRSEETRNHSMAVVKGSSYLINTDLQLIGNSFFMALLKGSPSKSGELMREGHARLLSDPKCAEKLLRLCPCHGLWLPMLTTSPGTDLSAGKGAAGSFIWDLCPLVWEPNLSLGPCPSLFARTVL